MTTETPPPQRVSPPSSPSRLSNADLKRKAHDAAARLRKLPGTTLDAPACVWLAELVATLANRVPAKAETRPRSTSRTGRYGR